MSNYNTYFQVLTTPTDEERQVEKEIKEENERFKQTPDYIEHWKKIQSLQDKGRELFNNRLEAAKGTRPTRFHLSSVEKHPVEKRAFSEEVEGIVNAINGLSQQEKRHIFFECFSDDIPQDDARQVDHDTLSQLHYILVQTVIDFIKENGLKDVEAVSFSADALQDSVNYGTWSPATDSFLNVEGLQEEEYEKADGTKGALTGRVLLGKSF